MIEFEFDQAKSKTNAEKHGIGFVEAQQLWDDADRISVPSRHALEPKYLAIGQIGNKVWTAIYAMRSETIRLVSVRRARKSEEQLYESHNR